MSIRGVEVTTEVTVVNPTGLGHHIAGMSSFEQAQVIAGFASGIDALDAVSGGNQLLWIAERIGPTDCAAVIHTLETLLAQMEAVSA